MPAVLIDSRFHGPPHSANGGYACGVVAALADEPVTVSLRVPPPLEQPMDARTQDGGHVRVHDRGTLVAEAVPAEPVDVEIPAVVGLEAARVASEHFVGFDQHPFPTCWTCGPDRPAGDGLRIFAGPVDAAGAETDLVAAVWTPDADVDAGDGTVLDPHVWAALDCPSYFGAVRDEPALLARLTADLCAPVRVGEPYVVLGWTAAPAEGRKRHGGSAVLDADGRPLAVARSMWVTLSEEALAALLAPA